MRGSEGRDPRRVEYLVAAAIALAASHIEGVEPLLNAEQVTELIRLADTLPPDTRLVVALSDARYWIEYFTCRPALSPYLAVDRLETPGPLFLVSRDPTVAGVPWPSETISDLRSRDTLVLHGGGLLVARAEWNDAFFGGWREPLENEAVLALARIPAPPCALSDVYRPPVAGQVAGWLLFWLLGLARLAFASPAVAAAAGLPATLAFWWALALAAGRLPSRLMRRSPASSVTAA